MRSFSDFYSKHKNKFIFVKTQIFSLIRGKFSENGTNNSYD